MPGAAVEGDAVVHRRIPQEQSDAVARIGFDRELALRPKTVLFVTHHIDEAVMLADRLVVFSAAPGRVVEVVEVPVERPRDASFRQDPRFVAIAAHVRRLLMHRAEAA